MFVVELGRRCVSHARTVLLWMIGPMPEPVVTPELVYRALDQPDGHLIDMAIQFTVVGEARGVVGTPLREACYREVATPLRFAIDGESAFTVGPWSGQLYQRVPGMAPGTYTIDVGVSTLLSGKGQSCTVAVTVHLDGGVARPAGVHQNPNHEWDFRGTTTGVPVTDVRGFVLAATPFNGSAGDKSGVVLDGRDGYVEIDTGRFLGDGQWSLSVAFQGGSQDNTGATVLDVHGIRLVYNGTTLRLVHGDGNNIIIPETRAMRDAWMHVIVTCTGRRYCMYINGLLAQEGTTTVDDVVYGSGDSKAYVGRSSDNASYFDGTIAYVRIWVLSALTAHEAAMAYVPCMASVHDQM